MVRERPGNGSVEGRVPGEANLRSPSGPEGSSGKRAVAGAAGSPDLSWRPVERPSRAMSTAGARPPLLYPRHGQRREGTRDRRRRSVPQVPPAVARPGDRPGARHPRAGGGRSRGAAVARVPLLRTAGTGEAPPPGVRFVLATTEPHKMPATIVGRCQRFDFRRVSTDAVADHLERVAKEEGVTVSRDAAEALARQGEGSVRDALSLLDQSVVLGGGTVSIETVRMLVGAPRTDLQFELADALAVGDARGVFELVNGLVQEGQDLRHVTGQILAHVRDLLLVRSAPDEPGALDVPADRRERLGAQAAKFSVGELSRILSLLLAAQTDMRWTTSPRLTLELALVRSAIPEADPSPGGLGARM